MENKEIKTDAQKPEINQNLEDLKQLKQQFETLEKKISEIPKIIDEKLKNLYPPTPKENQAKENKDKNPENPIQIQNEIEAIKKKLTEQEKQKIIEQNKQIVEQQARELFKTVGLDFNKFKDFLNLDYGNPQKAIEQVKQFYENLVNNGIVKPKQATNTNTNHTEKLVEKIIKQKLNNQTL